jgi:hypothetical protein
MFVFKADYLHCAKLTWTLLGKDEVECGPWSEAVNKRNKDVVQEWQLINVSCALSIRTTMTSPFVDILPPSYFRRL